MRKIKLSDEVEIAYSEKKDGNIDRRYGSAREVQRNLIDLCRKLGRDVKTIIEMQQVHKTNIARVGKPDRGKVIGGTDGMITNEPDIVLMLRVADCIPVFLVDPQTRAIGLVHSGWRGSIGKIVLVAIEKMILEFGTEPQKLRLVLGPSIQKCCNVLSVEPLQTQLPEWKPFIETRGGKFVVDLPNFVVETAVKAGVKRVNITLSNKCTVTDQKLFSYRRDQETGQMQGRFAAFMGLNA